LGPSHWLQLSEQPEIARLRPVCQGPPPVRAPWPEASNMLIGGRPDRGPWPEFRAAGCSVSASVCDGSASTDSASLINMKKEKCKWKRAIMALPVGITFAPGTTFEWALPSDALSEVISNLVDRLFVASTQRRSLEQLSSCALR